MKRYLPIYWIGCVTLALCLVGYWLLHGTHFDVWSPAGAIAKQEHSLMLFALILSAIVVTPVFTMLGLFAWRYRAGAKARHDPEWSENRALEVLWWGIPIIIIVVLATVAWRSSHTLDPYRPIASSSKTLEVKVVALQWKWLFIYPDQKIATVNKLVVAENMPIHFTITADAPMSAFWIPALGTQIYAMNGMSSQLNLIADHTGEFDGYSSNINGPGYSDMKFKVYAQTADEFNSWVAKTQKSPNVMDESAYNKLAQPNTTGQASYALTDADLYDKIINKYMPSNMMDNGSMEGM